MLLQPANVAQSARRASMRLPAVLLESTLLGLALTMLVPVIILFNA